MDLEISLASRLTYDGIGATPCFNVIGHGLDPLRFSTALETIDMGLVRQFEIPVAFSDAKISKDTVFGILDGIHSGVYICQPMEWCNNLTLIE